MSLNRLTTKFIQTLVHNHYTDIKFKMYVSKIFSLCFYFQTDQGIKNLPASKADQLAGSDPDYAIRDLFNAIANKNFPSWSMKIQIMTYKEAEKFRYNPFDVTKVRCNE